MRTPFTGVGTALVTPFTRDGSVDEAAVKRLARRQIDGGVHFLSPWTGLAVLGLYAAVALAIGGWLLVRRDA